MAEKVAKTGIQRDNNFMYYIKKGDVWRVPRKQPGQASKGKAEKISSAGIEMDYGKFIYFLDGDGDIARQARQVGGSKRKAKAAKPAAKKAAKKPAAKKPAKKAAPKKAAKKGAKKKKK